MVTKPNNAGEDMWLRAQIANKKFKPDVQTQDTDRMQFSFVLYMTQLEAIFNIKNYDSELRAPSPHSSAEAPATRQAALQN